MSHFILNKVLYNHHTYNTAIEKVSELDVYLERAETAVIAIFKIKTK